VLLSVLSLLMAVGLRPRPVDGDAELLARIAQGDRAALASLYEALGGQALAVALRVLGSRSDAEEVLQDAFVEVWTRAGSYDVDRGGARAWVLAIARNRAIDRLRRRGAVARMVSGAANEPTATGTTPLELVEQRQAREKIQAALRELTPEQRQVLELGYFEGLSQSEIAARLNEPLGTIKTRVRAALQKLAALVPGAMP
jgi:RNA polymerase sigma-70 factor (ECF subfamily)